jgi:hypothetical protein
MPLDATSVLRNSEHALNPADNATRHPTNGTTDGSAHWTGSSVADSGPLLSSAYDSLSLHDSGHSENSKADRGKENIASHKGCSSL